mmetsp:Transcript_5024/g.11071  ORF Transcript_5024/g.11071 Transcript_5024/m.11071 type:complete len:219 (+) Transcript_5024:1330-1986(+)
MSSRSIPRRFPLLAARRRRRRRSKRPPPKQYQSPLVRGVEALPPPALSRHQRQVEEAAVSSDVAFAFACACVVLGGNQPAMHRRVKEMMQKSGMAGGVFGSQVGMVEYHVMVARARRRGGGRSDFHGVDSVKDAGGQSNVRGGGGGGGRESTLTDALQYKIDIFVFGGEFFVGVDSGAGDGIRSRGVVVAGGGRAVSVWRVGILVFDLVVVLAVVLFV